MKNNSLQRDNDSVYPGQFVPHLNFKKIKEDILSNIFKNKKEPLVNISELIDAYKIEIALPGVKKENLLIETNGKSFSISVIQNKIEFNKLIRENIHEFEYSNISREIPLPVDADTDFICAEFTGGILNMHIPKSKKKHQISHQNIVVY